MSKKFYLKDWHGKEKEFTDEKIFVRGEDGELIQFTQGEGDKPAVVQPLEVTESGTYTAPDGVDGYSPVTVNVQGGGGGLPAGIYWEALNISNPSIYGFTTAELNGELYAFVNSNAASDASVNAFYKWENGAWTTILENFWVYCNANWLRVVEYGGKLHFVDQNGGTSNHYTFDGTTVVKLNALPATVEGASVLFVQNNKLKVYIYKEYSVYVWDDASDVWTKESTLPSKVYAGFYNVNGTIYVAASLKMYTYNGASLTQVATLSNESDFEYLRGIVVDDKLYSFGSNKSTNPSRLFRYDTATNQEVIIGAVPGGFGSSRSLAVYQNKLAFTPCYDNPKYQPIIVLHEVTE